MSTDHVVTPDGSEPVVTGTDPIAATSPIATPAATPPDVVRCAYLDLVVTAVDRFDEDGSGDTGTVFVQEADGGPYSGIQLFRPAIQPANVEIVQGAAIPLDRVRPRKAMNIALSLALGLVFGGGTAFSLEALRRTIRTPQDVMHELRLPVLGMIPRRNA